MISIILPAYNEEKAIKQSIDKINEVMNKIKKYSYEIIVIDDGSNDNTYEHAKKTNAKVIKNPHNLGYGISLKKCIEAAKYETLIICDADLSYPVDAIPDLIKKKEEGYDMVVGQRTGKFYKESPIKFPFRIILRFLVEYVAERKIPDINSGLRIFRKHWISKKNEVSDKHVDYIKINKSLNELKANIQLAKNKFSIGSLDFEDVYKTIVK